jgi:hypothetical protein
MMFEPADEGATGIALTAPMPAAETARNAAANKVFIGVSFLKSSFAVRFAHEPGGWPLNGSDSPAGAGGGEYSSDY